MHYYYHPLYEQLDTAHALLLSPPLWTAGHGTCTIIITPLYEQLDTAHALLLSPPLLTARHGTGTIIITTSMNS